MKVLALVSDRTIPTITGTRVRNHYLWPAVQARGVEVKILGVNTDRREKNPQGPPGMDCHLFSNPLKSPFYRLWKCLTKSFQEWPRSRELCEEVHRLEKTWKPDIIHSEELRMAFYLPIVQGRKTNAKQTVSFHNVESELLKMTGSSPFAFGKGIIDKIHQHSWAQFEENVIEKADHCFAYSPVDKTKYQEMYSTGHWGTTQNGTNASGYTDCPQVQDHRLLIVGSLSYAPNIHGLNWFLKEVLPDLPDIFSVVVAGSRATTEYKQFLRTQNIEFIDTPDELASEFQKCALCIVPVFEGSGTRGKILESLAHGRMVITTQLGNEGLPMDTETGVVIAEDKASFIKAISHWGRQPELRKHPASQGRQYVLDHYDWGIVAQKLINSWEILLTSGS